MIKLFLAAGVAAVALTATPAEARKHYTNTTDMHEVAPRAVRQMEAPDAQAGL